MEAKRTVTVASPKGAIHWWRETTHARNPTIKAPVAMDRESSSSTKVTEDQTRGELSTVADWVKL
jgi:hypothetical protein